MTTRNLFGGAGMAVVLVPTLIAFQYSHKAGPSAAPTAKDAASSAKYQIVDGHFHLLNFVQETDGIDAFLKVMDETGVPQSVIIGMPVVKQWEESQAERPTYYLDDDGRTYWYSATDFLVGNMLMKLPSETRKRLHPFICGLNSADNNAVDHVERMMAAYPGLWEGIGEVFARHDDLTALTYGETSRANTRPFDRLISLAEKHDMPILIHSNIGSAWRENTDYLSEIEYAVKNHPNAKIIWAHCGISRRIVIPNHTQILDRMLGTYPNLRVDISWVIFEQEIAPNGVLNKDWPALIEKYPERFIIGSDVVGSIAQYKSTIQRYYLLLDTLQPETAKKVAGGNFLGVLPRR